MRNHPGVLGRDGVGERRPMQPEPLGVAGFVVVPNEDVVGPAGRLGINHLGQSAIKASLCGAQHYVVSFIPSRRIANFLVPCAT